MNNKLTCVILAGGLGTRLASVVSDVPKPMAQVAGRPFLEYIVDQVQAAGCTDLIFCTGYKGNLIEAHFGDGNNARVTFYYSHEPELRGTAGAIAMARSFIRSNPFLVLNGDSYCPVDLTSLLAHHYTTGAQATVAAVQVSNPAHYGAMTVDTDDRILRFQEKGKREGITYVNAGIYALDLSVLDQIPSGRPYSLEQELFPRLAGAGLYAFKQVVPFMDIGTPASFAAAQITLPGLVQRRLRAYS